MIPRLKPPSQLFDFTQPLPYENISQTNQILMNIEDLLIGLAMKGSKK